MKRITFFAGLILILTISACSSVKITDAWKADDINSIANDNFLVIVRTDDNIARQRFETEIANKMREKGLKATESYKKFPNMPQNKKLSQQEIQNRGQFDQK